MRILFIGTGEIGLPTLKLLHEWREHDLIGVVTQPDKPVGRDQKLTPPPIKQATQQLGVADTTSKCELGLPLLQPPRIKAQEAIMAIRGVLQPDLIVVMAYGQILPREVLEIPKTACLNLHASLLPRWRGAAPIQAAIAAGDRETGITVMYMDEGLDTGEILLQKKIEIAPDETGGSLHDRLAQLAPDALREAISLLAGGNAPRRPQENELATYAPKLEREHGRIDWAEPAQVIKRKIRAFDPWPGTFMNFGNRKLKIFRATIVDRSGKPGEILPDENELVIAAGKGALSLDEVQLEGKRRMSAADFLRGHARITHL
jgi:methionyl-tRNA formyltransferase